MPTNWVRGVRRIGWVATLLLTPPIIYIAFQETKEFAGYNRELIASKYIAENKFLPSPVTSTKPQDPEWMEVEPASADLIIKYLEEERQHMKSTLSYETSLEELRREGSFPYRSEVEILRVNKIKFIGWTVVSIVGVAIILQGSISILAWVLRGFKG
jgi:hypothetical protein